MIEQKTKIFNNFFEAFSKFIKIVTFNGFFGKKIIDKKLDQISKVD